MVAVIDSILRNDRIDHSHQHYQILKYYDHILFILYTLPASDLDPEGNHGKIAL